MGHSKITTTQRYIQLNCYDSESYIDPYENDFLKNEKMKPVDK